MRHTVVAIFIRRRRRRRKKTTIFPNNNNKEFSIFLSPPSRRWVKRELINGKFMMIRESLLNSIPLGKCFKEELQTSFWMDAKYICKSTSGHYTTTCKIGEEERKKEKGAMEIDRCYGLPAAGQLQVLLMTKFPSSCERMNSIATKGNTTVQFLPFRVLVLWCMNECGRTLASTISSHAIETQVGSMQRGN